MNLTLKLTIIIVLNVFLSSCSGISQAEYTALKTENEQLKKEIDDLKFGPDKLISQTEAYINNKEFASAKSEIQKLFEKHPASSKIEEANKLLIIAEQGIKNQQIAIEKARLETEKKEKERLSNATKKLRTKYDDIKGITWYYDKSTPQYANYNSLHIYMGKSINGKPWLRFKIQYAADDWLFIQSYIIKTDNETYTINTAYGEVETDNGYGGIWEWYDVPFIQSHYNIIKDIISSKNIKLRCNGKQYHRDRNISDKEKQGLQNILDAYEALGGELSF